MRFGCCVNLDGVSVAQDAGYDYVELAVANVRPEQPEEEFQQVLEKLSSLSIVPEAWNCLLPKDLKVTGPEVDSYRLERYLRTAFKRIEELGGEIVVFGSGGARRVPDGFDMDQAKQQFIDAVTLAGQIAGTHGITIAVEPLNRKESNIVNSVSEGCEVVRAVDHPFVKVLADLYHMDEEKEPLESLEDAGDDLVHTHTADTGRRFPGSGSYPHREFFDALRTIGYNDRMSVECTFGDLQAECSRALQFLRQVDADTQW